MELMDALIIRLFSDNSISSSYSIIDSLGVIENNDNGKICSIPTTNSDFISTNFDDIFDLLN